MNSMSKVDIANLALHLIGGGLSLINLDEDKKEAKILSRIWTGCLQSLLMEHEWTFALAHKTLDVSAEDNATNYTYDYALPADCLHPVSINDFEGYPYVIEGQTLYCDVQTAVLKYIKNIEDVKIFSPGFARAMAHKLAVDMAPYLEKDNGFVYQKYLVELRKAIGQDLRYAKNNKTRSYPYTKNRFDQRDGR